MFWGSFVSEPATVDRQNCEVQGSLTQSLQLLVVLLTGSQESRELEKISLCHGGQSEGPDCAEQGHAERDRGPRGGRAASLLRLWFSGLWALGLSADVWQPGKGGSMDPGLRTLEPACCPCC